MTRWWLAAVGVLGAVALFRFLAIGRKAEKTLTEQRAEAWGGMPKRYRQTQAGKPWKLRMSRRAGVMRKSA